MGQADGRDDERPVHRVTVTPFSLGITAVTNAEYDHFCRDTGRPPTRYRRQSDFDDPQHPVTGPSWFDAAAYCEWLSLRTGLSFRLPTEAEWEFAARANFPNALFPWGDGPAQERANYHQRWRSGPEPVATSEPNAFGLFDMCENVHEWCFDWYEKEYYASSPSLNPTGPSAGSRRASRGGSWRHQIKISRCAARSSIPPEFQYADYGFRLALPAGSTASL
jgi:formylglycine-generating enzyme required for sulfatase activity